MYWKQPYVIKFVREVGVFPGTPVSSINKTDRHDIIEILLKVVLNTITFNLIQDSVLFMVYFR